jgi:hypothetical protein
MLANSVGAVPRTGQDAWGIPLHLLRVVTGCYRAHGCSCVYAYAVLHMLPAGCCQYDQCGEAVWWCEAPRVGVFHAD